MTSKSVRNKNTDLNKKTTISKKSTAILELKMKMTFGTGLRIHFFNGTQEPCFESIDV